jgi:hypothetical protein
MDLLTFFWAEIVSAGIVNPVIIRKIHTDTKNVFILMFLRSIINYINMNCKYNIILPPFPVRPSS